MALDLGDLILRIHAAAFDPATWNGVVEDVRVALHARGALLHTPQVRALEDYWFFNAQFDQSEIETYARDWMAHDVWAEGARTRGLYATEGIACVDDALVERRRFRRSAFFHDFLRDNDIDRMVTLNLHRGRNRDGGVHTQLSIFSGVGKEAFSSASVQLLEHLEPHLLVATRNYCYLRSLLAFSATAEQALNDLAAAVFAVDREGRLVFSNGCGDDVLRGGTWLSSIDGKLVPGKGLANCADCSAALRGVVAGIGVTQMLELGLTGAQRILIASPIGRGSSRAPVPPNAMGLLWLVPDHPSPSTIHRMAQLFELTLAESRLLAELAGGHELTAAAQALGISVHTARNQLKAIRRKTGRRTQAQLLALLNRLAAIVAAPSSRGAGRL